MTAIRVAAQVVTCLALATTSIVVPHAAAPAQAPALSSPVFTDEQLDPMLAGVALYPDALLSQVLMACTYPVGVAAAAKWSRAHPGMKGEAAVKAAQGQPWDPSVQSLVAFPEVVRQLGAKPIWVQLVGDAFLAQPADVMDRVQHLRRKAQEAGNLKESGQRKVVLEQGVIRIEPASPMPTLRGGIDWQRHEITQGGVKWNHDPEFRKGTPYRDDLSRLQFDSGIGGADQRQEYRGRDAQRDSLSEAFAGAHEPERSQMLATRGAASLASASGAKK